MQDSFVVAAAHFSSLVIRTIGLLAASVLVLQSLYLVAFTIYITRKRPPDTRQ